MLLTLRHGLTLFGVTTIAELSTRRTSVVGVGQLAHSPSSAWAYGQNHHHDDDGDDSNDAEILTLEGPFGQRHQAVSKAFVRQTPFVMRHAFDSKALFQSRIWPNWQDILDMACCTASQVQTHEGAYENEDDITEEEFEWSENEDDDDDDMMSPGVSARLIRHVSGQLDSFQAHLGPFAPDTLEDMINEQSMKWSLLMNDVDRYRPDLADWMDDAFGDILPRWRRDDAQISIAPTGGGIGPHVDSYDVFLIQAAGTREWRIRPSPLVSVQEEMERLVPDLSVRILRPKKSEGESFVAIHLQEGDVLYLPPRVTHWGISTSDDCMTLSVGCRAPAAQELVARLAEDVLSSFSQHATRRYREGMLPSTNTTTTSPQSFPSLTMTMRASMKDIVLEAVNEAFEDEATWDAMVGKLATEPKRLAEIYNPESAHNGAESANDVLKRVQSQDMAFLKRTGGVSFATSRLETKDEIGGGFVDRLFANGEMWEIANEPKASQLFHRIEQGVPLTTREHLSDLSTEIEEILLHLIDEGLIWAPSM